ncbi:MAG: class I SAM-dependent methyltransferase [Myxococcaceae bacterium]
MHDELKRVESSAEWYTSQQLSFDRELVRFRFQTLEPWLIGPRGLELGCGDGSMTKLLRTRFERLTVVEGSQHLLDQIPDGKEVEKVHSLFEAYQPPAPFNSVVLEHILEHVENPVDLLKTVRKFVAPGGRAFIGVPNAHSFHRLAAVKMGMLKDIYELNERDHAVGHRRVYSWDSLEADLVAAGLTIEKMDGIFFKPFSNGQIDKFFDARMVEGFYRLGYDFPRNAAEISVVCRVRE